MSGSSSDHLGHGRLAAPSRFYACGVYSFFLQAVSDRFGLQIGDAQFFRQVPCRTNDVDDAPPSSKRSKALNPWALKLLGLWILSM